jgi:hypothetical protein
MNLMIKVNCEHEVLRSECTVVLYSPYSCIVNKGSFWWRFQVVWLGGSVDFGVCCVLVGVLHSIVNSEL